MNYMTNANVLIIVRRQFVICHTFLLLNPQIKAHLIWCTALHNSPARSRVTRVQLLTPAAAVVLSVRTLPNRHPAPPHPNPIPSQQSFILTSRSTSPLLTARPVNRRPASRQTHTTTANCPGPEHRSVPAHLSAQRPPHHRQNKPQHIRDDEEPDVRATDVDLVEMGDSSIAGGNGDVAQLNVHVVLSCIRVS